MSSRTGSLDRNTDFTHEAMYQSYIEGILDREWWRENLNQCPPVIFGAGSGLSPVADTIAYMRK